MSYDNWKLAYPPEYDEDRDPGCLCGEGDAGCPVHGEETEQVSAKCHHCGGPLQCLTDQEDDRHPLMACADGSECKGLFCGPSLPVAFCRCDAQLQFERCDYGKATGWRCHCEGCVDGETFGDGTSRTYVKSGEGRSPWDALEELAAMHFDCDPEELMKDEEP